MKVGRTIRSPLALMITRCPGRLYILQNLAPRVTASCAHMTPKMGHHQSATHTAHTMKTGPLGWSLSVTGMQADNAGSVRDAGLRSARHAPMPLDLSTFQSQGRTHTTCLVVDDAPGVRHKIVILPREGVVPRPRRAEGVAADAELRGVRDGLAHVYRRQSRQSAAQAVACESLRWSVTGSALECCFDACKP